MVIAVTGASGLVGSALSAFLTTGGHRVIRLVRRPARNALERQWNPRRPAPDLLSGVDAVVHLAGASIAGRFTDGHKAADPRQPHRADAQARRGGRRTGRRRTRRPSSARRRSAIYGFDRGDAVLCEDSVRGDGFLADVVADWEAATGAGCRGGAAGGQRAHRNRAVGARWHAAADAPAVRGRAGRPARQRRAVAVLDRPRRPARRLLPRAVRRSSDRARQRRRAGTGAQRRLHQGARRSAAPSGGGARAVARVRGCCWGSRAHASSPRPTSGWCRPSSRRWVTGSGTSTITDALAHELGTRLTRHMRQEAAHQAADSVAASSVSSVVRSRNSSWLSPTPTTSPSRSSASHSSSSVAVDLGVELQRQRAAEHERLRRVRGPCDLGGARRQRPPVEMPLEPRPAGHHARRASLSTSYQPISGVGRPRHRTAERLGERAGRRSTRRAARPRRRRRRAPSASRRPPRCWRSASSYTGQRAPERDDHVVAGGIGERHVAGGVVDPFGGHHLEGVDVEAAFGERLAQQGLGREMLVVDEQNLAAPRPTLFRWRHGRGIVGGEFGARSCGTACRPRCGNCPGRRTPRVRR